MDFDKTIQNNGDHSNNDFVESKSGFDSMGATFDGIQDGLGVVDRYVLKEKLGAGGFGSVYLAEDTEAKILVALKILPSIMSDIPEEMEKVRDNFALVSQLSHSNIAGLKHLHKIRKINFKASEALGVSTGGYLVVMEYVAGSTLSSWKKAQGGKISFDQAVDICSKVAEALDYAHGHKIIHRDIKPSNIMVTFDETGTIKDIKVLDFGLAAEIRSSMSRVSKEQGDTSGTRPYMAPEQWSGGKQGTATDQYSLAVMFYELVSGEVPFHSAFETGDSVIMLNVAENKFPESLEELDKKKNIALLKGLAKEPTGRFASCGDFITALSGKKISYKGTKTQRKSGKSLGIVAAVCIVGLLAFGAHMSYTSYKSHQENQKQVEQQQKLNAEKQAQVNELKSRIERALSTGDLSEAGSGIAELEALAGAGVASQLKMQYEAKAGEREVNKRSANAGVAYDSANKLDTGEGFSKKLQALEIDWRTAENARQGKAWGQALTAYDSVIEKCKELQKFDAERSEAKSAKVDCDSAKQLFVVEQQKLSSKDAEVDKQSKEADSFCQKAVAAFSEGASGSKNFVEAMNFWKQASSDYNTAKKYAISVQDYRKAKQSYENAVKSYSLLLEAHGGGNWKAVKAQALTGKRSVNDPTQGIKSYESALSGLSGAVTEAKQIKDKVALDASIASVEKIIGLAESSKKSGDWQKALDLLSELDTSSTEIGVESSRLTKEKKDLIAEAQQLKTQSELDVRVANVKTALSKAQIAFDNGEWQKVVDWLTNISTTTSEVGSESSRLTAEKNDLLAEANGRLVPEEVTECSYIVQKNDSVGKIALKFDVSVSELCTANKIKNYNSIYVGQKLVIPGKQITHQVSELFPKVGEKWIAELGNGVTMELLRVEAGSFTMGSSVTEREECVKQGGKMSYYDDEKQHRVTLTKPFWIGKYEVTQKQYETVMGSNPSRFKGPDNPVEQVSWNDAMEFCRKLTDKEHASGRLPADYKYTLPTEAQWEFAARGGKQSKGYKYSGSDDLDRVGWYSSNSGSKTHEVGQKIPNKLGLYDMSGNVYEWCSDWYDSDYYDGGAMTNPTGASSGSYRVFRGGCWSGYAGDCRSAHRDRDSPADTSNVLGFRLSVQTD